LPAFFRGGPHSTPLSVRFVLDEEKLGQDFSYYFGFPYQFSFHRLFHTYLHLFPGLEHRPNIGQRTKWFSLTPPQENEENLKFLRNT
jgi:hypothetical protein